MKRKVKVTLKYDWYEKNLNKLTKRFWEELEKHFPVHKTRIVVSYNIETVSNRFGYEKVITEESKQASDTFMIAKYPLKWGFDGDEYIEYNYDFVIRRAAGAELPARHIVANKPAMKKITRESISNFNKYMRRVILDLKLKGVTALMDRRRDSEALSKSIFMHPKITEECASTEKDSSVDYVVYYPIFTVFR